MKTRTVLVIASILGVAVPRAAHAQAPSDAPPTEPAPGASSTPADTPPVVAPSGAPTTASDIPTTPAGPPPVEASTPKPNVHPRTSPPFDPRWTATPAPIWWGKPFEPPEVPVLQWYGWQTMIALPIPDALAIGGYINDSFGTAVLGVSLHMLTGPIVHWSHGHVGRGFGVLGLNLTLGAVGALFGGFARPAGVPLPAFLGYLAGPVLDIALFSTEMGKEPMNRAASSSPLGMTFGVLPMVDSTRRGLLLTGQF